MITQEIIRRAQQGDSEAFTRIYNETIKMAYYVAKRILLDEQAVEDVLQESYIAVYEHLGDLKTGNFQGWVDTIVANRSKNYLRKKNPILFSQMETEDNINIEFEEEKIEFRPDEKVDYDETKRLVMNIVDGLSDEQRLAVILFYFEQRSVKEIAQICECSENTVKSRLNYARKKIKEDVLELEKKGTKLYSISVLPFLYWIFKEEFKACEVPATTSSTVAKVVVEETVKTGMALGTKIAIGVAVATISIGGIALGSTLLKDNTPPTEQSSEKDTQQDTETEQDTQQETEQITELSRKEIDDIVRDFLISYQPVESIDVMEFTYIPSEDAYSNWYGYSWCGDMPVIVMRLTYKEINGQAENISNCVFYNVDKETGKIIEMSKPSCIESNLVEYGYSFYVGKEDLMVRKKYMWDEVSQYYLEEVGTSDFSEKAISEEEANTLLENEEYKELEFSLLAALTANKAIDEAEITKFLESYEVIPTLDVYELKGYPATTCYYRADIGVHYVSFVAGQCNVLVLATPYSTTETSAYISYRYEVYYFDEAAATYKLFENQPDTTHDEDAYPTTYNFDVFAENDGISDKFIFENGGMHINVEINGKSLKWKYYYILFEGENSEFLEWKKF